MSCSEAGDVDLVTRPSSPLSPKNRECGNTRSSVFFAPTPPEWRRFQIRLPCPGAILRSSRFRRCLIGAERFTKQTQNLFRVKADAFV